MCSTTSGLIIRPPTIDGRETFLVRSGYRTVANSGGLGLPLRSYGVAHETQQLLRMLGLDLDATFSAGALVKGDEGSAVWGVHQPPVGKAALEALDVPPTRHVSGGIALIDQDHRILRQ
ncbi:hypothetical protein [Nonomuraea sp. NPDC050786]|uniref:hypothetical protein n=1 Tax=Nonomuraea sp. NPDC050786 TaxID=3154840 RepID=UPI0033BFCA6E